MKAESLQKPVANYELTFIDTDNVEIEFFDNIKTTTKQDEHSKEPVTVYEYDYYRIKVRNRNGLIDQLNKNYSEWLKYAISLDTSEQTLSDLEIVKAQYSEYDSMDIPSVIKEMELQDPALAEEFLNMRIEFRGLIYTLGASEHQATGYSSISVPKPSEALKKFKNDFEKKFQNKFSKH